MVYRSGRVNPSRPGGAVVVLPYYDEFQGKHPAIIDGLGVVEDIIPID